MPWRLCEWTSGRTRIHDLDLDHVEKGVGRAAYTLSRRDFVISDDPRATLMKRLRRSAWRQGIQVLKNKRQVRVSRHEKGNARIRVVEYEDRDNGGGLEIIIRMRSFCEGRRGYTSQGHRSCPTGDYLRYAATTYQPYVTKGREIIATKSYCSDNGRLRNAMLYDMSILQREKHLARFSHP